MTERIVVGSDGRKYITHEPAPRHEWVGLTDEEMRSFGADLFSPDKSLRNVFCAIEDKLREKNAPDL